MRKSKNTKFYSKLVFKFIGIDQKRVRVQVPVVHCKGCNINGEIALIHFPNFNRMCRFQSFRSDFL